MFLKCFDVDQNKYYQTRHNLEDEEENVHSMSIKC